MNKRLALSVMLLAVVFSVSTVALAFGEKNPTADKIRWNVLFLMSDQHNVHFMGCDYQGNEGIETPNLDRLAREGMIFRKAYDTYPVCAPTRASLLTSVYPMAHGQYGNDKLLITAGPEGTYSSIGHVFRNAGYNIAFLGKQHSNVEAYDACPEARYNGKNLFQGFDYRLFKSSGNVAKIEDPAALKEVENNALVMKEKAELFKKMYPESIPPKPQPEWEKELLMRQPDGNDVNCRPMKHVADTQDGVWALDVIEYLKAVSSGRDAPEFKISKEKPFCMFLSFPKPHYPWTGPAVEDGTEYYYMYSARPEEDNDTFKYNGKDRQKLRIRDVPQELYNADPSVFYEAPEVPRDAEATRFARARYAGNISWLDHLIGKIMGELEKLPDSNNPGHMLSETTIVSYTSDHGDMMGEKLGAYNKMKKYEGSARVPFILKVPGILLPGQSSDILINHVDMWPTIAGLAGLGSKLPRGRDGRDLSAAILANNPTLGPQRIFTVSAIKDGKSHPAEVMSRTQRFKFFILDPKNRREDGLPWMVLFDMDNDPYETRNLAYDPQYRNAVVAEVAAIREFMARYGIEGCVVTEEQLAKGKGPLPYQARMILDNLIK